MRNIWIRLLAMLVAVLLLGILPAMAEEEDDLGGILGGIGSDINTSSGDQDTKPSGDLIALDDLNISVRASDYVTVRQDESGFVYIYTIKDDSIPYLMIGEYDTASPDFAESFTKYMSKNYADLKVALDATPMKLGGNEYTLIVYNYTISGYAAVDMRLFRTVNDRTYMFATKAILELGLTLPEGYLEQVASSMEMLAGGYHDYPLHVDSTHSIEKSDDDLIEPTPDIDVGGNDSLPMDSTNEPIDDADDTQDDSIYDAVITFDPSTAGYAGTWVTFEGGYQLYLPSSWMQFTPSEEDDVGNMLYLAYDPDDPDFSTLIQISWTEDTSVHSIEDIQYYTGLSSELVVEDTLLINNIPCVTYTSTDGTYSGVTFFHPLYGEPYVFNLSASDYSKHTDLFNTIFCSLSLLN